MTSGRGLQAECSGEGHSSSAVIHAELARDVPGANISTRAISRLVCTLFHSMRYFIDTYVPLPLPLIGDNHSSHIVRFGSHRNVALLPGAFKGTLD